jgi:hypothetical protein
VFAFPFAFKEQKRKTQQKYAQVHTPKGKGLILNFFRLALGAAFAIDLSGFNLFFPDQVQNLPSFFGVRFLNHQSDTTDSNRVELVGSNQMVIGDKTPDTLRFQLSLTQMSFRRIVKCCDSNYFFRSRFLGMGGDVILKLDRRGFK